jgi:hypothetical protein
MIKPRVAGMIAPDTPPPTSWPTPALARPADGVAAPITFRKDEPHPGNPSALGFGQR